jgi:hypothetical protein
LDSGGRGVTSERLGRRRPVKKERFVPDEPTQDRPRRRPVLLAMLVAAAVLLAIAGSGVAGSGGGSRSSDESTGLTRDSGAGQSQQGAPGTTRRGRHCHHDGNRQAPQQSPTEAPPV